MSLIHLDMTRAACTGVEDSVFHQPSGAERAKSICATCPILEGCREAALQMEKCWGLRARGGGVYGGMTAEERLAEDRIRWKDIPIRRSLDEGQRKAMAS